MSIKLKALGLGLLAAMAVGAFAVANASAVLPPGSHFVSEATEHHLIIKGEENPNNAHHLEFHPEGGGAPIICTKATYHGTLSGASATTTQAIQVRPHYTECQTKESGVHNITVHVPAGCGTNVYEFTSGTPGTVHVRCQITITHPNCTIRVPTQTAGGAHYDTALNPKHAITLRVNTPVTSHYEGGICIFLGTTHTSTMTGAATVRGENTAEEPVGITAT